MELTKETAAPTIRRQLIELLSAGTCGVRELSQELHQSEKEIYDHLVHIERSLKPGGKRLVIEPPVCQSCGFVFAERTRPQPPSRCPQCKKTHIRRPRYAIR
jgi:predicted Zn-ribbon and HTH transcriptional regulator